MKNKMITMIILILMVFTITACKDEAGLEKSIQNSILNFANSKENSPKPVAGGTLNLLTTLPDTLNPISSQNRYVQSFSGYIFEGLVSIDNNQLAKPLLAEKWEVSNDGLVWTFTLRKDVTWHDNMPFSAEDVEFTFNTILDNKNNSIYTSNLQNVTTYAAIEKNVFRIILKKPDAFTAHRFTFPILPKHYFSGEDMLLTDRNLKPIGTGPYKFVSYDPKSMIILKANNRWWNSKVVDEKTPKSPYIEVICIKVYKNDIEAASTFQTREVDIAILGNGDHSKYNGRMDLIMKKFVGRDFNYITINMQNPILSEKAVRQAIAYSIDKTGIIQGLIPGQAVTSDLPVIPDTWLYNTNIVSMSKDTNKAKSLLVNNGWVNKEGVFTKMINGSTKTLKFEILVNEDNPLRLKIAEKIKEQLAETGIQLVIRKTSLQNVINQTRLKQFDLAMLGVSIANEPEISFLYASSEIIAGMNTSSYNSSIVDSYLKQILMETDIHKQKAAFTSMQSIIQEDVPYIGLYFMNNAVLYNKRIEGNFKPVVWNQLNDLTQWYIPTK